MMKFERRVVFVLFFVICVVTNYITWQISRPQKSVIDAENVKKFETILEPVDQLFEKASLLSSQGDHYQAAILHTKTAIYWSVVKEMGQFCIRDDTIEFQFEMVSQQLRLAKLRQKKNVDPAIFLSDLAPEIKFDAPKKDEE